MDVPRDMARILRGICVLPKEVCIHSNIVVLREGQCPPWGVTCGDEDTLLSTIRPCGMGVLSSEALDTTGSLHLTIGHLLKSECGNLEL